MASAPARQDSVVEGLACVARRSTAFVQRRLEVGVVVGTSEVADSLAVAADTGQAVVAVGTDRGCHVVVTAGRMRHRAEYLAVGSGRARRCALEQMPVSERRLG